MDLNEIACILDPSGSGYRKSGGRDLGFLGSMKGEKFGEQLCDYQILCKTSALCSWVSSTYAPSTPIHGNPLK
jgi:hypothetical protein